MSRHDKRHLGSIMVRDGSTKRFRICAFVRALCTCALDVKAAVLLTVGAAESRASPIVSA